MPDLDRIIDELHRRLDAAAREGAACDTDAVCGKIEEVLVALEHEGDWSRLSFQASWFANQLWRAKPAKGCERAALIAKRAHASARRVPGSKGRELEYKALSIFARMAPPGDKEAICEQALQVARELGDSQLISDAWARLALAIDASRGLPVAVDALQFATARLGSEHPQVAWCHDTIVHVLWSLGRFSESIPHAAQSVDMTTNALMQKLRKTFLSLALRAAGEFKRAHALSMEMISSSAPHVRSAQAFAGASG